jgi:hypothetical protein
MEGDGAGRAGPSLQAPREPPPDTRAPPPNSSAELDSRGPGPSGALLPPRIVGRLSAGPRPKNPSRRTGLRPTLGAQIRVHSPWPCRLWSGFRGRTWRGAGGGGRGGGGVAARLVLAAQYGVYAGRDSGPAGPLPLPKISRAVSAPSSRRRPQHGGLTSPQRGRVRSLPPRRPRTPLTTLKGEVGYAVRLKEQNVPASFDESICNRKISLRTFDSKSTRPFVS